MLSNTIWPQTKITQESISLIKAKRLVFTFAKPLTQPTSDVGVAENDECNDENVFTEIFGIKANHHNEYKRR
ncbi:hypothetical protein MASR2M36_07890 [Providencia sp.]